MDDRRDKITCTRFLLAEAIAVPAATMCFFFSCYQEEELLEKECVWEREAL